MLSLLNAREGIAKIKTSHIITTGGMIRNGYERKIISPHILLSRRAAGNRRKRKKEKKNKHAHGRTL
jgi:hypothetical protein